MKPLLNKALRGEITNYIFKAVIVGISPTFAYNIVPYRIYFSIYTVENNEFSDYFGFTEEELKKICEIKNYPLDTYSKSTDDNLKSYYNGYQFGHKIIYNPYSVLSFLDSPNSGFKPYWCRRPDYLLIKQYIADNLNGKENLEKILDIISGKVCFEQSLQSYTVKNLYYTENFFKYLLMTGYITIKNNLLSIPNKEVELKLFEIISQIDSIDEEDYNKLLPYIEKFNKEK